jgi:DUF2075 family protein
MITFATDQESMVLSRCYDLLVRGLLGLYFYHHYRDLLGHRVLYRWW